MQKIFLHSRSLPHTTTMLHNDRTVLLLLLLSHWIECSSGFSIDLSSRRVSICRHSRRSRSPPSTRLSSGDESAGSSWDVQDNGIDDEDMDSQVEEMLNYEEEEKIIPEKELPNMERAWRYAQKPLLRIGSKGATLTHGNSLRQLLEAHTVVKVKVNTRKYGTLEDAFEVLKELAEESGAPDGIELIQTRDSEKIILFGLPGTLEKIEKGDFPPPAAA